NAVKDKGRFTVALTGGSSPVLLHELLSKEPYASQIPWDKTFVFWGDERFVPLTDDRSNAKMAFETLLDKVPVPKNQVYPMWEDGMDAESFAAKYEQTLKDHFGKNPYEFDLILLGMGDDGHTASLFPGTAVLDEKEKIVVGYYLTPQSMYRITLTSTIINSAKQICFLAYGANKAKALYEVLEGERNPVQYPSQLIHATNGEVIWMVDETAAALLNR
ncbi:MAG: 6-phosphogluconolactonase, partial [Flavitalea sp.]